MKQELIDRLIEAKIIAVVRAKNSASLIQIAAALYDGGIRAIETTLTTPGAIDSIRSLPEEWRTKMLIGIGTVLDACDTREAIGAGANFVVTPVVRPEVVTVCNELNVPVACGAFTPTEALAAHEAGADFVKLFPAEAVGPAYIKAILAPLPFLKIIPTGGVTPENCRIFLDAGCVALGAGSRLVSTEILDRQDWAGLTQRAREFTEAL
jgi:2-dehydro-3-deoxyphosphogluconate aldolase/(4S)-4-hydroxy-2-oxoglutarate aldolase